MCLKTERVNGLTEYYCIGCGNTVDELVVEKEHDVVFTTGFHRESQVDSPLVICSKCMTKMLVGKKPSEIKIQNNI